jgi:rRNA-processing protein FCF1
MNSNLTLLIERYSQRGILIDTNILLLYFVGTLNRDRISQFKRTQQFIPKDYDLLMKLLSQFQKVATTPNILTEVNSLLNQLGEPERAKCYVIFAENIAILEESYQPSKVIAAPDWPFIKYGLTDCGLAKVAQDQYLVLTDDLKLTDYLQRLGIDTINFNNLRLESFF